MEEWWTLRKENLYLDLAMICLAVGALIISLQNRSKYRSLKFIFIYPLSSILQAFTIFYSDNTKDFSIEYVSIFLFLIVEFYSFFSFYLNEVNNPVRRRVLGLIGLFYFLWSLFVIFSHEPDFFQTVHSRIQSFCILGLVIIYVVELFNLPPISNLLNEPAFWITTACTILALGLTPILFSVSLFFDENLVVTGAVVYCLTFIIYSIVFGLLIRAFMCKPISIKI